MQRVLSARLSYIRSDAHPPQLSTTGDVGSPMSGYVRIVHGFVSPTQDAPDIMRRATVTIMSSLLMLNMSSTFLLITFAVFVHAKEETRDPIGNVRAWSLTRLNDPTQGDQSLSTTTKSKG